MQRAVDSEEIDTPITPKERKQIAVDKEWLLCKDGRIISKANLHGISRNFIQIGGVMTHPDYQGKGYAKQIVSAVCKHYLQKGKNPILFAKNDNVAANKVYAALGFQPIDEYIIAEY